MTPPSISYVRGWLGERCVKTRYEDIENHVLDFAMLIFIVLIHTCQLSRISWTVQLGARI